MLHKHNLVGLLFLFLLIYIILLILYKIIKRNLSKTLNKNTIMEEEQTYNLLDLSDYSLLHIFKYLSPSDLYNLSFMCKRLNSLVKEKNLWYRIDTRSTTSNTLRKIKYCLDKVNEHTEHLLICGEGRGKVGLSVNKFMRHSYPNLTVLALENQLIYKEPEKYKKKKLEAGRPKFLFPQPKLSDYPKGLVELSLRKTFVRNCEKFFKFSHTHMENLKVLILDECVWVEAQMLVPISKYPKLEILSLFRCKKLSDCDVAYISLAGAYGFTNLRILDVRFTGLGDQILKTFYKHRTLQELYFQDYTTSYALDRAKRRLAIAQGAPTKQTSYFSPYDDIPDSSPSRMTKLFKCFRLIRRNMQTVTDQGTASYNSLKPDLDAVRKVGSVLYRPPHSECSCGYIFGVGKTAMRNAQAQLNSGSEEIDKLKRIIEVEESLGRDRKAVWGLSRARGGSDGWRMDWIGKRDPCSEYEIAMFEHTAMEFVDFCVLKAEIRPELASDRKVVSNASDPELTLWDLYGNTQDSKGGSTDSEDLKTNTSSPEVADNSRLKSKDPDNKPSCSKRKFSPDTEDKSDTSDASDCESDSNESDTQKNTSTSQTPPPKSKNRRGSKRRRDNDGEPHFKTFILSPCSESNSGPSHSSVNLDWLRLRQDLVPMNGHLQDVPKVAIRKLSLRGYPGVSDHSLHFLSDLKLDLLDVTGTKVTKNGLTHFLLTNPQCRVLHQSACTCPIDVGF